MNRKIKIAVAYVEAGMGHITSATAVSDALKKYYGDKAEIVDIDFFKISGDSSMKAMEKSLIGHVKMAGKVRTWGNLLFQMMYLSADTQKQLRAFYLNTAPAVRKKSMELIDKLGADVIVNTHYLPAHFAEEYRRENPGTKLKTVIYNPDNNVHGWWDTRVDMFITNNPYGAAEAVNERGFSRKNVYQVDFLARNCVLETDGSKVFYREKYGIKKDNFTVILADGAYASSYMKSFALELIKSEMPLSIIAVAGKNQTVLEYFEKLSEKGKIPPNIDFHLFGFTSDICELYRAADVFVTKAGPNAILDSMFMHTPVIVNYWATPIEHFTKKMFIDLLGCGETIQDKKDCRKRIEQLAANPGILDKYIEKTLAFDKTKNGGKQIADLIFNELH